MTEILRDGKPYLKLGQIVLDFEDAQAPVILQMGISKAEARDGDNLESVRRVMHMYVDTIFEEVGRRMAEGGHTQPGRPWTVSQ